MPCGASLADGVMFHYNLSISSGSTGNTVDNDADWDTNKKQPGFAGSMWDNMGETGNF